MLNRFTGRVRRLKDKVEVQKYLTLDQREMLTYHPEILVVVARFDEDVDWCESLDIPYVIYNKGKKDLNNDLSVAALRNVGREGHTILHFIITHYNNLPERVIFTQADPFPHAPNFIKSTEFYKQHLPVQPLSIRYLCAKDSKLKGRPEFNLGIPDETVLKANTVNYKGVLFYVEELDGRFNVVKPYQYVDPGIQCLQYIKKNGLQSFEKLCEQLELHQPEKCYFNYAGIFSVNKQQILRNPLSTYETLMRFLLQNPEHGYLLERMWLTIFGYQPAE